jgi:hypothetical protein
MFLPLNRQDDSHSTARISRSCAKSFSTDAACDINPRTPAVELWKVLSTPASRWFQCDD